MAYRFKNPGFTAANAYKKAMGATASPAKDATALTPDDAEEFDDFDRDMLESSEQARLAQKSLVIIDDTQSGEDTQPSQPKESVGGRSGRRLSPSGDSGSPGAAGHDRAPKQARTALPQPAAMPVAVASKPQAAAQGIDAAAIQAWATEWSHKSGKPLKEVFYCLFRHSGRVRRAEASLLDPTAHAGCDPEDDAMLDNDDSDDDENSHDVKYGEALSVERLEYLAGI